MRPERIRIRIRCRAAVLLACLAAASHAARADEAGERQRIARERAQAGAVFEQRHRECEQRFAVTTCVEQARSEHRQTLLRLRGQESVLDEAQRKQRAAQRMAAIREKVSAEEAREQAPRAPRREPAMQVSPPRSKAASQPLAASAASAARDDDRAAAEARSRARFEARQREAQAQRDAAARRQAERQKSAKPPAPPLPDPAAR
jgi:colicin import membrane protein